ncbi:MAG: hypothetical protein D6806_09610 [Deltaproteobacteria bacterium]|nr:MAG: hypothetical protein D6806_09610 [Deltaproteobacteria bacterium]
MTEQQREELKQLHWMHRPKCGMEMKTILLNDVEVDKCFICGRFYLDEGELEKVAGRPSEFFKTVKDGFTV